MNVIDLVYPIVGLFLLILILHKQGNVTVRMMMQLKNIFADGGDTIYSSFDFLY